MKRITDLILGTDDGAVERFSHVHRLDFQVFSFRFWSTAYVIVPLYRVRIRVAKYICERLTVLRFWNRFSGQPLFESTGHETLASLDGFDSIEKLRRGYLGVSEFPVEVPFTEFSVRLPLGGSFFRHATVHPDIFLCQCSRIYLASCKHNFSRSVVRGLYAALAAAATKIADGELWAGTAALRCAIRTRFANRVPASGEHCGDANIANGSTVVKRVCETNCALPQRHASPDISTKCESSVRDSNGVSIQPGRDGYCTECQLYLQEPEPRVGVTGRAGE